jgi:type I restriction enzyme S subunit
MKAYPPYRDARPSGIDWLGAIPSHWKTLSLHYVGRLKSGESITALQFDENGEYPVYGGNGFRGNCGRFTHEGEYVLIGRQGALCGNINIARGKFFASEHAIVVNPDWFFDMNWLGYQLFSMNLNQYSVSAAQPGLSAEVIGRLRIAFPPVEEQQAIARFLDFKTAQIDALIEKKKKLLDKLAEKRTALISHAVTKGLDPDVAMKDSGVAWLGEVPKNWQIKKLKFSSSLINNKVNVEESSLPYLGLEHIESWTGRKLKGEISNSEGLASSFMVGDILFGKLRPYLAKVYLAEQSGLISSEALVIRCNDELHTEFLKYHMLSREFINIVNSSTYGSKMPRASWDFIGNLPVLIPSINEQKNIAQYLNSRIKEVFEQADKVNAAITRLAEYRSALITNAVTGKIDVRDFQIPSASAVNAVEVRV